MSFSPTGGTGRPPGPSNKKDADGFFIPIKRKRGRPRKVRDPDNESVCTTSSFDSLVDDDMGEGVSTAKRIHKPRTKKPPPIMIKRIDPKTLDKKLANIMIPRENFFRRLTRDGGANLYVTTNDEHRQLKTHLDTNMVEYITYTPDDEKMKMYVLYGLPDIEPQDISKYIQDTIKITPKDVKKMRIAKPSYVGQVNYVVYFQKQQNTSLIQLKMISGMFGYHVFWSHYQRNGPTQCYNCQGFFYSSKCCTLKSRCNRCGGKHKSSECPKVDTNTMKVPVENLRCVNCKQNHTSSYKNCPARLQIISEHQEKSRRQNHEKQRRTYVHSMQNYNQDFPNLTQTNTINLNKNNAWSVPQQAREQGTSIFTPKQLFQIFNEIVQIASSYRTKSEQLSALTTIYEKYVMND